MAIKQAFILAAGRATRMYPETLDVPKCMLRVGGKPVIAHILEWLRKNGIESVVMNLHHCYDVVLDYFSETNFDLSIHCSIEESLLGTAGGIVNCRDDLDDQFVVVYGDVLTNMDLRSMCESHTGGLVMASHRVANPQECGVIVANESRLVTDFVEKPEDGSLGDVVNAGVLTCDKELFVPTSVYKPDIGKHVIPPLVKKGVVWHWPLKGGEWLIDIGTKDNFAKAERLYDRK